MKRIKISLRVTFLLGFCCSSLLLTACEQNNKEPEFKRPMGPYGLPYRVGNLGGKPVLLGEESFFLEYEDSPVLNPENRYKGYKAPPRNFDSVITSFGVEMKYPTGMALVRYQGAPQESYRQYKEDTKSPYHQWVYLMTDAGRRYHPDLTAAFINSTVDSKVQSLKNMQNTHYIYISRHIKKSLVWKSMLLILNGSIVQDIPKQRTCICKKTVQGKSLL